jgi:hypothetical protein
VETDFRICEFAASWKRGSIVLAGDNRSRKEVLDAGLNQIAVIGNDSDFISLSPPGAVDRIVKLINHVPFSLEKSTVLADLKIDDFKLLLAYCIAGCDNMEAHVDGIGWVKAYNFAVASEITISSIETLPRLILGKGDEEVQTQMVTEIRANLTNFAWLSDGPKLMPDLPVTEWPQHSGLEMFAAELDENGHLVRHSIYSMVWHKKPEKRLIPPQPPGKKPPVPKGTRAPAHPGERPIPSNQFFVLEHFLAATERAYVDQWKNVEEDEDEQSDSESGCEDKTKRRKRGRKTGNPRKKRKKCDADTGPVSNTDISSKENSEISKPSRDRKPGKKRPTTVKLANAVKARRQASEAAKRGMINPDNGRATIPLADRMSLRQRYKTFSVRLGRLSKSVKQAINGMFSSQQEKDMISNVSLRL